MNTYKIALYPGDGIGKEVLPQSVRVLEAAKKIEGGFELETTVMPWGVDYYMETGKLVDEDYLDQLKGFNSILLGALGDPERCPDHIALRPLLELRQKFDQYAGLRPAKLYPGVKSPLASDAPIDILCVRENSEGEYIPSGGGFQMGQPSEISIQNAIHTRRGIERIMHFGFDMAMKRNKRLTMITKSNVLKFSMTLWDRILDEISPQYPEVQADKMHVDAAAMNLVRKPEHFDVMVASNLFGDILSDLAGAIVGSLGLLQSANINPEKTYPSMFEPVHGSAPDIAGKGIANPAGMILSAAMMIEFLGEKSTALRIRKAVNTALEQNLTTPDLGGNETTESMTDKIIGLLEK